MLEVHSSQGAARRRRRKGCPLHGPHVVDAVKEGSYVAQCLACGVTGPERQESLEAKLAFDQRRH
jgi:hypothetical protein